MRLGRAAKERMTKKDDATRDETVGADNNGESAEKKARETGAPEEITDAVVFEADPGADTAHLSTPAPEVEPGADPGDAIAASRLDESTESKPDESAAAAAGDADAPADDDGRAAEPPPKPRRSVFSLFNFLLILALAAAGGYYYWLELQLKRDYEQTLDQLESELARKADSASVDSAVNPLRDDLATVRTTLDSIEQSQAGLADKQASLETASEKLYELYGRDKNDWQLAEVEYLLRIAQHKLILQDDFAGAAVTLQAASDLIARTGDPGLLPVRVRISEEIADLKTRVRPDLVGIALKLAELQRQVQVLTPGFPLRIDETASAPAETAPADDASWRERVSAFFNSLVEVRQEDVPPTPIEASVVNVGDAIADNLKLARWAVLERDNRQYRQLIADSVLLFREFYDLDNAANAEVLGDLERLAQTPLVAEKPDISGSLLELQRILAQREAEPSPTGESADG